MTCVITIVSVYACLCDCVFQRLCWEAAKRWSWGWCCC